MCWDGKVRHPQEKYPEKNDRGIARKHHGKIEEDAGNLHRRRRL